VITSLMPARHSAPRWLRGTHDTLAVRITRIGKPRNFALA